jgi:6-phosphogluconolactonase
MRQSAVHFEILADADAVADEAARAILTSAARAISARGCFRVVLAGGTTPLAAYRRLAREDARWEDWEVYFGDERCLPIEHAERNSLAAQAALLGRVLIPPGQVHPIPAELGPDAAAAAYTRAIAPAMPFDLVLLGMGEDGHTASLFPGRAFAEDALVIPVRDAPKPPADRVSLTPRALGDCRAMLILVTGTGKREALAAWRQGADLPVARAAEAGRALVLADRDADGA